MAWSQFEGEKSRQM